MTNHPTSEELFAYRDGELGLEKRGLVEAHVLSCTACQKWLDEMSDTEGMLRQEHAEPDERYFETLTRSVMERVAPGAQGKASARADDAGAAGGRGAETVHARPGRRRSLEDEPRGRAPRLPWPAIVSAVSAAAAVLVVAVMLFQHPSVLRQTPAPEGLGRAKDAAGEAKEAAPPAEPSTEEIPATGAPGGESGSLAKTESAPKDAGEPAPLAAANSAPPAAADRVEPEVRSQSAAEAVPEAALQKSAAAPATPQAAERARADGEAQAGSGLAGAASPSEFPALAARYGLPLLYDPANVSSDALLRAEPDLRALYMMGRAGDDSARVRLYLAEAARARAGDSPDTEAFDTIVHHYQRAVRLARDPETGRMAMKRLQDFVSNHAPPR